MQASGQAGRQACGLGFYGFVFSSQTMCAKLPGTVQGKDISSSDIPVILGRQTIPVSGDLGQTDEHGGWCC